MLRPFCNDCDRPIDIEKDNFIQINQIGLAKDGKILRVQALDFCSKECMNSWVVKAMNRPTLITP